MKPARNEKAVAGAEAVEVMAAEAGVGEGATVVEEVVEAGAEAAEVMVATGKQPLFSFGSAITQLPPGADHL
jgi:hypothetical protein